MNEKYVQPFNPKSKGFSPPKSIAEAEDRIEQLLNRVARLLESSSSEDLFWSGSNVQLSPEEVQRWKSQASLEMVRCLREVKDLRTWLKAKRGVEESVPVSDTQAMAALRICAPALRELYAKGVPIREDALQGLERADHLLGFQRVERLRADNLMKAARACMQDGVQNTVFYGGWIAVATNQPDEVDHLVDVWKRAPRCTETERNQVDGCLPNLVETLAYFRRFLDAADILRMADDNAAAYGWVNLGKHSRDAVAFRRGQQIAESRFKPMQLAWFLLGLHSHTGAEEHLKRALASVKAVGEVESSGGKKAQGNLILGILRALLDSGDEESARNLALLLRSSPVAWLRASSCIYRYSGTEADKAEMLSGMAAPEAETSAAVKDVVRALDQQGQRELATNIISAFPNPASRCAGYSTLALARNEDEASQRNDLLDLAEKAYFEMKIGTPNTPHTLELFARAEIAGGRMGTAVCATSLIHERDALCSLLLMLHAITSGTEVPYFIKERYSRS